MVTIPVEDSDDFFTATDDDLSYMDPNANPERVDIHPRSTNTLNQNISNVELATRNNEPRQHQSMDLKVLQRITSDNRLCEQFINKVTK